jgi:hypothetical protein
MVHNIYRLANRDGIGEGIKVTPDVGASIENDALPNTGIWISR